MAFENQTLHTPVDQASSLNPSEDSSLGDSPCGGAADPASAAYGGARTPETDTVAASMMAHWGVPDAKSATAERPAAQASHFSAGQGAQPNAEATAQVENLDTREAAFMPPGSGWDLGAGAWSQLGQSELSARDARQSSNSQGEDAGAQAESVEDKQEGGGEADKEQKGSSAMGAEKAHQDDAAPPEEGDGDQGAGEGGEDTDGAATSGRTTDEQQAQPEPGEGETRSPEGSDGKVAHKEPKQGREALPSVMQLMETSFGEDFSNVTFSKGLPQESKGAKAAADNEHISLGREAADLDNPESQRILAHELAHIVQKRKGSIEPDALDAAGAHEAGLDSQPSESASLAKAQQFSNAKKSEESVRPAVHHETFARRENLEREADSVAERVVAGESVHVASGARAPRTQFWGWGLLEKAKKAASDAVSWGADKAKKGAVWAGNTAGSIWNKTKQGAAWVRNTSGSIWNKTKQGVSWVWNQAKSADWKKLGVGALDLATDFIPGVSNVKDAYQAISGKNPITGEKLGWGSRILSGIFAIPGVGNLAKYIGKGGKLAAKLLGKGLKWAAPFLKKAGKWALGGLKKAGKWALGGLKKVGKWAWGGLKRAGKWAWGGLKKAWRWVSDLPGKAGQWIKDKANKLRRKVKEVYYRITRTKASGKPDPHAVPDGKRTNIPKNADDETRRSLERENDAADVLAQSGYKVKQNPGTKANGTNPDYLVEGRIFDCYAPETKNPRNIWEYIKKEKVDKGQADRVILNLSDSKVDLQALKKQFTEWEMEGLKEVIVVRDGKLVPFYP